MDFDRMATRMCPLRALSKILALCFALVAMCQHVAQAQEIELSQPSRFTTAGAAASSHGNDSPAEVAPANFLAAAEADADRGGIPLAPPRERVSRELTQPRSVGNSSTVTTILASLGLVIGIFLVFAWFLRRTMPRSLLRLPGEVVEQLGRTPLSGKQNLHLLRVGRKLLLVAVTPLGAETLTEISDPDEVERLTALCKQQGTHGPVAEFREVMRQFEREPAATGFLGTQAVAANARGARRGGYDA
jgi:flagellar biogenesis protein FliO